MPNNVAPNFVDVTISKHVTAEQENVFIVINFVSLIYSFRRNVKIVAILIMTNVIAQITDRIQDPPTGAGFFRGW